MLLLTNHWIAVAGNFILNNPYPAEESTQKIYYTSFSGQPKTLDPAKSYSSNEYQFIGQIYEPVLQYDYLTRPYTLLPLTAVRMPEVRYYNKNGKEIAPSQAQQAASIAYSVYTIHLKAGIMYQPHPAFARAPDGQYRYHNLDADFLDDYDIDTLADFEFSDTRELIADDYIYEIKRLANPAVNSPIYGLLSEYIEGFREFAKTLPVAKNPNEYIDLRPYPLRGVKKIDNYTFEITIKGLYPQFAFWLAMPFFAPIPWEADRFYSQAGMDDKNLDLSWYPVGTGPFMLSENNPNSRMVLEKNPNYHPEFFPEEGSLEDEQQGYLHHKNQELPLIEKAIYTLEKEAIPRWNKFLQGYFDLSGVGTDSFDQAIKITHTGATVLTPEMKEKGIRLTQVDDPSIYYMGFNMLDPIVGGNSERARKLRQAISIAVNFDENIAIFFNGRGQAAQGPIPPGIFGHREGKEGINPYVYKWIGNEPKRRSIQDAKALMKEAGYPGGRDKATGKPLILHYDVPATGGPDDKEQLNWMHKQFARIGIALNIRATQYNRFQEKMRNGNAQIFSWGWNADYPDPENFLFLLYGPNGKVKYGGENATNYHNPVYDRLFDLMKNRNNDAKRQELIDQMVAILRRDAPWIWGINSQSLILSQQWVAPIKTNTISQNTLKYIAIDVPMRNHFREIWNRPILWPVGLFLLLLLFLLLPFIVAYFLKQRDRAPRIVL
ncbi:ABC transporter substrate-binding protein [Legionella septentrionalis]|uniref:Peptide ABC transporter substrate-binding protein n=1 Tax=Legionella septentrionalis TaxID=2498109 RepID=A0A3S0WZJ1_9GAMM|nr:ABC transporter substrate-binding protein [Legionella septentrionalis]RUQ84125.1 peptide ABC transporter substrate-binding protein [Legionella septentrionalis]RUQ95692.1 peptide ABC transporter substrate-binding protein [Legionella septentrionalis]